jgi:glycosyltransferase involved in cell wall biosynthesis
MKNRLKVTFAGTVYNEENNIREFLESMLNQTRKPDEIIIVDGGSKDKTYEILKEYSKKNNKIKVFQKKGANIPTARNIYMEKAKGDILFTGDAGTKYEKDWIKKILKVFKKTGADVVGGLCFPKKPRNDFERIVASKFPKYDEFSEKDWKKYFPSIRQIAYKTSSWRKLGRFPEDIDRADDTVMDLRAVKAGLKYEFAKDAKVYWHARDNLKSYLKLAYLDSVSDGQKGIIWKRKVYLAEFGVIAFTLSLIFLGIFFDLKFLGLIFFFPLAIFLREGYFIFKRIKNLKLSFQGGWIMILLFFSHGFGGIRGLLKKYGF